MSIFIKKYFYVIFLIFYLQKVFSNWLPSKDLMIIIDHNIESLAERHDFFLEFKIKPN